MITPSKAALPQNMQHIHTLAYELEPFIFALKEDSQRVELEEKVLQDGRHLFSTLRTTARRHTLVHLLYLTDVYLHALEQLRSGKILLSFVHLSLLGEVCRLLMDCSKAVADFEDDAQLEKICKKLGMEMLAAVLSEDEQDGGDSREEEAHGTGGENVLFLSEVTAILDAAEQELVLWDYIALDLPRVESVADLFRRLERHFSLYNFPEAARICQSVEATLKRYIQGEHFYDEYPETVLIRTLDALRAGVDQLSVWGQTDIPDADKHLEAIQGLVHKPIGELLIQAGLAGKESVDEALEQQKQEILHDRPRRSW